MDNWRKLTPAIGKRWLYLIAGITWSGVGIYLVSLTREWLAPLEIWGLVLHVLGGVVLATCIHLFGFTRFANRNIQRIKAYQQERVCLFAFQSWTSYPLVAFMISLGIFLRKYSPIPKPLLAIAYIGIGGGLFLSSFLYHKMWVDNPNN